MTLFKSDRFRTFFAGYGRIACQFSPTSLVVASASVLPVCGRAYLRLRSVDGGGDVGGRWHDIYLVADCPSTFRVGRLGKDRP